MNADGCCGIMACAKLSDTADHLDDDKNEGDQFELDYREMNRTGPARQSLKWQYIRSATAEFLFSKVLRMAQL